MVHIYGRGQDTGEDQLAPAAAAVCRAAGAGDDYCPAERGHGGVGGGVGEGAGGGAGEGQQEVVTQQADPQQQEVQGQHWQPGNQGAHVITEPASYP